MWGPATALAMLEQHRRAKEAVPKVRTELFRLRCFSHISVEQKGALLRLTYGELYIDVEPLGLLNALREIHEVGHVDGLWLLLKKQTINNHETLTFKDLITLFALFCILLAFVAVLFSKSLWGG